LTNLGPSVLPLNGQGGRDLVCAEPKVPNAYFSPKKFRANQFKETLTTHYHDEKKAALSNSV